MGWAERANPNSNWNQKRREKEEIAPTIVEPEPAKKNLWQKIKKLFIAIIKRKEVEDG